MNPFTNALSLIRQNRKSYLALNGIFYGLIAAAMIVVALHPAVQETLTARMRGDLEKSLPGVARAYQSGHVLAAMGLTFVVNSLGGALASISLPSLVVPFSGMLLTALRMMLWGLILSPTSHTMRMVMIPHSLTLILEGQAYILAAFGSYLLGKWWLFPATGGMKSHLEGYVAGVKANLALYPLVLTILAIAAIYEASEVVIVRHLLAN